MSRQAAITGLTDADGAQGVQRPKGELDLRSPQALIRDPSPSHADAPSMLKLPAQAVRLNCARLHGLSFLILQQRLRNQPHYNYSIYLKF